MEHPALNRAKVYFKDKMKNMEKEDLEYYLENPEKSETIVAFLAGYDVRDEESYFEERDQCQK